MFKKIKEWFKKVFSCTTVKIEYHSPDCKHFEKDGDKNGNPLPVVDLSCILQDIKELKDVDSLDGLGEKITEIAEKYEALEKKTGEILSVKK